MSDEESGPSTLKSIFKTLRNRTVPSGTPVSSTSGTIKKRKLSCSEFEKETETPDIKMAQDHDRLNLRDLMMMIKPFDGTRKGYQEFVINCEHVLELAEKYSVDPSSLIKQIIQIVSKCGCEFARAHSLTTWKDVKKICDDNFLKRVDESQILYRLTNIKQKSDNVFKYYTQFANLIKEYSDLMFEKYRDPKEMERLDFSINQINKIATSSFINGLDMEIKRAIVLVEPTSLKEAYELARRYEDRMMNRYEDDGDTSVHKTLEKILKIVDDPNPHFAKPRVNRTEVFVCQICSGQHSAKDCRQRNSRPRVICQICNKSSHSARECYSLPQNNGNFNHQRQQFNGPAQNQNYNNGNRFNSNNNRNFNYQGRNNNNNRGNFRNDQQQNYNSNNNHDQRNNYGQQPFRKN